MFHQIELKYISILSILQSQKPFRSHAVKTKQVIVKILIEIKLITTYLDVKPHLIMFVVSSKGSGLLHSLYETKGSLLEADISNIMDAVIHNHVSYSTWLLFQ